ncbi:MAG: universal stress protein [Dehalococcoidia bacterium]
MFSRILVCLDGSGLAEQALPYASAQAKRFGSKVILLQIVNLTDATVIPAGPMGPAEPEHAGPLQELSRKQAEAAGQYLGGIAENMESEGVDVSFEVLDDPGPGEAIVDFTDRNNMDLIVMTTHGRSGLGRTVFGSVADHVMRQSGLPILVKKAE